MTLQEELHVGLPLQDYVVSLRRMAREAGCDGVIASPHEIATVRAAVADPEFLIVTPGVRPVGAEQGDQARVMTPEEAVRRGANYLVIGRPIVSADGSRGRGEPDHRRYAGRMTRWLLPTRGETARLGEALGRRLQGGEVLALNRGPWRREDHARQAIARGWRVSP